MTKITELEKKWRKNPEFVEAYNDIKKKSFITVVYQVEDAEEVLSRSPLKISGLPNASMVEATSGHVIQENIMLRDRLEDFETIEGQSIISGAEQALDYSKGENAGFKEHKMPNTFNNVWDALEDDPVKRENLKLLSDLMSHINSGIEKMGVKLKEKWLKDASKSFLELISDSEITPLDEIFFSPDEVTAIKHKSKVMTTAIKDQRVNRIRASRLKLLNYVWKGQEIGWLHFDQLDQDDFT